MDGEELNGNAENVKGEGNENLEEFGMGKRHCGGLTRTREDICVCPFI